MNESFIRYERFEQLVWKKTAWYFHTLC